MRLRIFPVVAALLLAGGCAGEEPTGAATGKKTDDFAGRELPAEWAASIDNPWLPLKVGASWTYEKTTQDATEEAVITVTDQTETIEGITATVVKERVTEDGELIEKTDTWYAQDADGNVWNLGETSTEYEGGRSEVEGWKAGADGAKAGVAMLADPQVVDRYQQKFVEGAEEDRTKVLSLDESVRGPAGRWTGVLQTENTDRLDPESVDLESYARDVGLVQQHQAKSEKEKTVLVKYDQP